MAKMIDITKLTVPGFAKEINETNSNMIAKHDQLTKSNLYWHKIIVKNCENVDRDTVLKTIINASSPHDLVPFYYKLEGNDAHFLCKSAGKAIKQLCYKGLVFENPTNKSKPFKVRVILGFKRTSEINVSTEEVLINNLHKRYNQLTRVLNLDSFYKEGDIAVFFLTQKQILQMITKATKSQYYQFNCLKMANNNLKSLPSALCAYTTTLTSLDLKNNNIEKLSDLNVLKTMQVTELWLEGNPVCSDFDGITYVRAVKEICPKIERLDGLLLGQNGFPSFRRNYLCNTDAHDLVDQFLEHYFTIYDANNRGLLESLYHKKSLFSITSNYLPGHASSSTAQLKPYNVISRNLKTIADLARNDIFLFKGNSSIVKILKNLPQTEHDPYSFTVDLVYYTVGLAVIVVTGIYREPAESLLAVERYLGFTRNFILTAQPNGEYNIVNDQLHVHNATTLQQMRAFKMVRVRRSNFLTIQPARSPKQEEELTEAFKLITTLNLKWSKKCLEECNYDLKKALILFIDLYKLDKIPQNAFIE